MKNLSQTPTDPTQERGPTGESIELEEASYEALSAPAPRHDPDRKWPFAMVHSDNWDLVELDGKPILLPDFERILDRPGSNNVKQRRTGPPNTERRDGRIVGKGRTLIDRRLFLRATKELDTDGRPWYYAVGDVPRVHLDGTVLVKFDQVVWDRFRVDLLRERRIRPPSDMAMERMRMRWQADADRSTTHQNDLRAANKRERASLHLSMLEEAAERSRALWDGREVSNG